MNATEARYGSVLEGRLRDKDIVAYMFESVRLRMADNTTYTPDYMVITTEHIEFHEVKGTFARDDAVVKYKVAKELFPWFVFKWCVWTGKQWQITDMPKTAKKEKRK